MSTAVAPSVINQLRIHLHRRAGATGSSPTTPSTGHPTLRLWATLQMLRAARQGPWEENGRFPGGAWVVEPTEERLLVEEMELVSRLPCKVSLPWGQQEQPTNLSIQKSRQFPWASRSSTVCIKLWKCDNWGWLAHCYCYTYLCCWGCPLPLVLGSREEPSLWVIILSYRRQARDWR